MSETPEKKETTKEEVAVLMLILAVLCFFFLSKVLALYIFGGFLMLLPIKKWYIAVISGVAMWMITFFLATNIYKVPVLNITSPLENNSKEYRLTGEVENFSEIFVNDEKIEVSDKNFEKNIVLENLETSVKILAKNGFLQEKEMEITIKRNETEEESQKRTEAEKQKEQEAQEKAKSEIEKKKETTFKNGSAKYVCREGIKKILKSPTTAKFSNEKDWYTGIPGKEWMVKGKVTSQNGFGAMLTSNYECVFTWQEAQQDFSYTYQIVE